MGINSRLIQIQKSSDPQIQIIKGGGSTLNYRINPGNKHQINIFRLLKALLQQCQEKNKSFPHPACAEVNFPGITKQFEPIPHGV